MHTRIQPPTHSNTPPTVLPYTHTHTHSHTCPHTHTHRQQNVVSLNFRNSIFIRRDAPWPPCEAAWQCRHFTALRSSPHGQLCFLSAAASTPAVTSPLPYFVQFFIKVSNCPRPPHHTHQHTPQPPNPHRRRKMCEHFLFVRGCPTNSV